MKNTLLTLAGTLVISGSAFAQAQQPTDFTPYNMRVKVGALLPIEGSFRNYSKGMIAVGVDYNLGGTIGGKYQPFLSGELFVGSVKFNKPTLAPLCINLRFRNESIKSKLSDPYAFFGIGAFFYDLQDSKTVVGMRGGFGAEFDQHYFTEVTGYISAKDSSSGASGIAVSVFLGMKF